MNTSAKDIVTTNWVENARWVMRVVTTNTIADVQLTDLNIKTNKSLSTPTLITTNTPSTKLTKIDMGPKKPRTRVLGCIAESVPQYTKPIIRK